MMRCHSSAFRRRATSRSISSFLSSRARKETKTWPRMAASVLWKTGRVASSALTVLKVSSNGQTEGQITKLKLVKRQMYGRGKLDLLEARLIGAT